MELNVGDLAASLAVLLLVFREFRAGVGTAQDRLVKTLNETISAQAARIVMLEGSLTASNARITELEATVRVLTGRSRRLRGADVMVGREESER